MSLSSIKINLIMKMYTHIFFSSTNVLLLSDISNIVPIYRLMSLILFMLHYIGGKNLISQKVAKISDVYNE